MNNRLLYLPQDRTVLRDGRCMPSFRADQSPKRRRPVRHLNYVRHMARRRCIYYRNISSVVTGLKHGCKQSSAIERHGLTRFKIDFQVILVFEFEYKLLKKSNIIVRARDMMTSAIG